MFGLAQIMYISAFGFIPLNIMLGTILYAMCSLGEAHSTLLLIETKISPVSKNSSTEGGRSFQCDSVF